MGGLGEGCKEPYSQQVGCIIKLALSRALFTSQKILQNFSDSPSHRIFRHMHEILNIDKNKN